MQSNPTGTCLNLVLPLSLISSGDLNPPVEFLFHVYFYTFMGYFLSIINIQYWVVYFKTFNRILLY